MIALRMAKQRYDDRRGKLELWLTFYTQAAQDPLAEGFSGLATLNDGRIPPSGATWQGSEMSADAPAIWAQTADGESCPLGRSLH